MGCLCSRARTESDDDTGRDHNGGSNKRVFDQGYSVYSMEMGQDGQIQFASPVIKFVDSKGALVQQWSMHDLREFRQAEPDFIFSFETKHAGTADVGIYRFIVKGDMTNPCPPDLSIVLNRAIRGSAEPQLDSTCTYSTLKRNKATCFSSQGARRVGWGAPDYAQLRAHSKLSGNLTDYCTPLSRSISLDSEYAEPDEWSCDSSQENLYSTLLNARDSTYETMRGIQTGNIDAVDVNVDEEINDQLYSLAAPHQLVFTMQGDTFSSLLQSPRSRVSVRRRARGLTVRRKCASSRREFTRSISSKF